MNQQIKTVEGFIELKKYLQKSILQSFAVTVSDNKMLSHYFKIQDEMDNLINCEMGWHLDN